MGVVLFGEQQVGMRLDLNDKLFIVTDRYAFVLHARHQVQSGKTKGDQVHRPVGYYGSLRSALHGAIKHTLLDDQGRYDCQQLLARIDQLEHQIQGWLDENSVLEADQLAGS